MVLDVRSGREYLEGFDLKRLFTQELGWDSSRAALDVTVDGRTYALHPLAEKRGMVAFECSAADGGTLPDYRTRRKIESAVAKSYLEHLLVYVDAARSRQIWQWVRREHDRPLACREHRYEKGQAAESLLQKLREIAFTLDEEDAVTVVDVSGRVRKGFDVEHVTKRFYERFKTEHAGFLSFIRGIPDDGLKRWYASVMLNRLMFIYFIQKKGFLDGDPDYLQHKLGESKSHGADTFFRGFLCPLFFEGFAKHEKDRSRETNKLLGKVPYLNGGLFTRHQIEEAHGGEIEIADSAFERILAFFEQYQWHLDERPRHDDNEINPDVLGYIFEKYINQKEMGAYYTKEDVTGYIAKYTILPHLLDSARHDCRIAFEGESSVWRLLAANPDRYIYGSMKEGADLPLPAEIAAGVDDVSKRGGWNVGAPSEYALPTETWREVVARRQRYLEIRGLLRDGKVKAADDLITYNLDIRQFLQDAIEAAEGPELLRAFWKAVEKISVLDPTCGSGAFLFAALNILEPVYEACLNRMQAFLDELELAGDGHQSKKYADFRDILRRLSGHRNRRYCILKAIVVNNLYGVDIVEEATEICKLRLFLKLVAQIERAEDIEPLPDVDFNIRAGNTLVGFATLEEARTAVTSRIDFDNSWQRIEERAEDVERLFKQFRYQQTEGGGEVAPEDKKELRQRLEGLEGELNGYLAREYGVDAKDAEKYQKWLASHQPFHWFVEFYSIIKGGGFDAIIGNPPWREYSAIKKHYTVRDYTCETTGNLYALCTERSLRLRGRSGYFSFIVQLPLMSSTRMGVTRRVLTRHSRSLHLIPFDDRPGKLFEGLEHCRSVIFISAQLGSRPASHTLVSTRYQRWATATRSDLFGKLEYATVPEASLHPDRFPKLASASQAAVFGSVKVVGSRPLGTTLVTTATKHFIFYQEATGYWVKATAGVPYYAKNGIPGSPAHGRFLYLDDGRTALAACAILNSSLFYVYFVAYGDCFHLSDTLVSTFPITPAMLADPHLVSLGEQLMEDLSSNAERKSITMHDGDLIVYDEFLAWKSKETIDRIDARLANHYVLSAEQLDFIINYDIKYRMGSGAGD